MSEQNLLTKINYSLVVILSAGLFFYTCYRAATLGITHDEGVVYGLISTHSLGQVLCYIIPGDHMLNSLLIKLSCLIFPDTELAVRLPNLAGHLLYLIFSFLLLKKMNKPLILIPGFILLNFNPYLLDFFSIARGYGLSVSLMMISLYFAFSFIREIKISRLALSVLFAVFSVLAVYTLLNYLAALYALVFLTLVIRLTEQHWRPSTADWKTYGWCLLILLGGLAWLFLELKEPLMRLRGEYFIYVENDETFYSGTLRSIAFRTIYNFGTNALVTWISLGFLITWAFSGLIMVILALKKDRMFSRRMIFVSFVIFLVIAAALTAQNAWLNIRFISNRTATFVIPLAFLTLIGIIAETSASKIFRIPGMIFISIVAGFFLYKTLVHANFKSYLEWPHDSDTREMVQDVMADRSEKPGQTIKMGIEWYHEPSINFYRSIWKLDWMQQVDRSGYYGDFDYFYVTESDTLLNNDFFKNKMIMKRYEESGMVLLKTDHPDE